MDKENLTNGLSVVCKNDWIDTVKQKLITVIEEKIRTLSIDDYKKLKDGTVIRMGILK